ncbi:MAG: galactitol-1-phosphate 5-dehydrogenase [Opitutaceae bacterium]
MKALVLTEYKKLVVTEVPEPVPGPGEVLIEVAACGICGSDIHGYDGNSGRRLPPIIMGHECAGTIAALGKGTTGWAVGDRVTMDSMLFCGRCPYCTSGHTNLCESRQVLGVSCPEFRKEGAFARFVTVPASVLVALPDHLPFEQAAFAEPLAVSLHAVRLVDPKPGSTAVVVGAGMIGLLVIQVARAVGCSRVIAVDLDRDRLELARSLGASHVLNPADGGTVEAILALTDGKGAECAFEAVGHTNPLRTAIGSVRKGGRVGLIGNLSATTEFPLQQVVTREITLFGSCACAGEFPEAVRMIAEGTVSVASLITDRGRLEDGPGFFDRLYRHEPGHLKVILSPNA